MTPREEELMALLAEYHVALDNATMLVWGQRQRVTEEKHLDLLARSLALMPTLPVTSKYAAEVHRRAAELGLDILEVGEVQYCRACKVDMGRGPRRQLDGDLCRLCKNNLTPSMYRFDR